MRKNRASSSSVSSSGQGAKPSVPSVIVRLVRRYLSIMSQFLVDRLTTTTRKSNIQSCCPKRPTPRKRRPAPRRLSRLRMLPTIRRFESVTFLVWSREIGLSHNVRDFEMLSTFLAVNTARKPARKAPRHVNSLKIQHFGTNMPIPRMLQGHF
jgi:hypothetical protein